jgi:uncharacterized membrane protein
MKSKRFFEIDFLRGTAVLMMIIFHFLWNLNYLGIMSISIYAGFWGFFQKITAGTFIFLSGTCLAISHEKHKENYKKHFFKRALKISAYALGITLFSAILFPKQLIYFGILHLIAVSVFLGIFFVQKKKRTILTILTITVLYALNMKIIPAFHTLDFFPLIPWFGVFLLGTLLGDLFYKNKKPADSPKNLLTEIVSLAGRKSLLIYFIHQPILFAIIYAVKGFLGLVSS